MISIFDDALATLLNYRSRRCSRDCLAIRGLWRTDYALLMDEQGLPLKLSYIMVQTREQGCCYTDNFSWKPDESLLGGNVIEVIQDQIRPLQIAMIDAAFRSFHENQKPRGKRHVLKGNTLTKAQARAEIVFKEVLRLIEKKKKKRPKIRVLMIGVVTSILSRLACLPNVEVFATDFAPHLVGTAFCGVQIADGSSTPALVTNCDVSIVTGMTLATDTIDQIIDLARDAGNDIVLFAQTAASFHNIFLNRGVSVVVSEPFPFYLSASCDSQVNVYRNDRCRT
jgi:hypothetical protein